MTTTTPGDFYFDPAAGTLAIDIDVDGDPSDPGHSDSIFAAMEAAGMAFLAQHVTLPCMVEDCDNAGTSTVALDLGIEDENLADEDGVTHLLLCDSCTETFDQRLALALADHAEQPQG